MSFDPVQRRPDISLARAALGWSPQVPLDEGLESIIRYFADRPVRGGAAAAVPQTASAL